MTRGVPATRASKVQAAMNVMAAADRRVTARPEKAAIDAPRNSAAPNVSTRARNGSARIATNAARTKAVTGSQASSGSGARSRRRSTQPAGEGRHDEDRDVDAERRAVEDDLGEQAEEQGADE